MLSKILRRPLRATAINPMQYVQMKRLWYDGMFSRYFSSNEEKPKTNSHNEKPNEKPAAPNPNLKQNLHKVPPPPKQEKNQEKKQHKPPEDQMKDEENESIGSYRC